MTKISVVIPVYNTEKFLEKCLNSVINQTFNDFEVICINDGSTDNSESVLNSFAKQDNRIKIINQQNRGVSIARNEGLKIAKGDYISFIDSDDSVAPNYLENLYNAIISTGADIAVTSIIRIKKGKEKYRVKYDEIKTYTTLQDKIDICKIPDCSYVWNKLYKSELAKRFKFKEGVFFEDVLWIPEVVKNANKVVTVPDTYYIYFNNPNSIVQRCPSAKKQEDVYNAKKYAIQFFDDNHLRLAEKERNISKKVKFFCGIPLYKIKEYNDVETIYLFSFLPIIKCYPKKKNLCKILNLYTIEDYDITHRKLTFCGIKFKYPRSQYRKLKKTSPYYYYKKNKLDITTLPPAEGQTRDIQLANLALLEELDYVCKQNGLKYWLDFGTLLGAVRHKGFIPWDDDIDIGMLRDDYAKIIDAFAKTSRNPDIYADIFIDKRNNSSIKVLHKKCNLLFVDIFPYDFYPRVSEREQLDISDKIMYFVPKSISGEKTKDEIVKEIEHLRASVYLKPVLDKESADLVYGIDYCHNYKNWFYSQDYFFPLKTMLFEGKDYPVPNNSEKYLQRIFGNYMEYPNRIGVGHSMFLTLTNSDKNIINNLKNNR